MKMNRFIIHVLGVAVLCSHFGLLHCQAQPKDAKNSSQYPKAISINHEMTEARLQWLASEKSLKILVGKLIKMTMPILMREAYSRNISAKCMNGFLNLISALKKLKLWAFQMLDACGKLPEGFLTGTLTILGDYSECVDVFVEEKSAHFQGQYCTIHVNPPVPQWQQFRAVNVPSAEFVNMSAPDSVIAYLSNFIHNLHTVQISLGICIPSVCSKQDVHNLIQIIPEKSGLDWGFEVDSCEVKQELEFTAVQVAILCVFGILAFLILCGSLAGLIMKADDFPSDGIQAKILQYLLTFSAFSNTKKLAAYKSTYDHLGVIHGIMFLCFLWIILTNTFMYLNLYISSNIVTSLKIIKMPIFEMILNRTLPIQTFFFLSGFISAYKWMITPAGDISIWKYVFKRYLRYTLTYILLIALVMLTPVWGSGPSWSNEIMAIYDKCYNNWWANILYINNFLEVESSCLEHTWLFGVDAQLHLLGLFILIPLKRRPLIGLMVNFSILGASLLTIALTNVYYDIPPSEMMYYLNTKDKAFYASHSYNRVYTHFCMYCSGIAVGYYMSKNPKIVMPKWLSSIACFIAIVTGLSVMGIVNVWNDGILPSPLVGAVYATFGKVSWAALLSAIVIICASGNGGDLNGFLSWKPFAFFARLAFIAYLIHPVIIKVTSANMKAHLRIEQFELIYTVLSHLTATYFLSYLCFLAFEAPFLSIAEILQKKCQSSSLGLFSNSAPSTSKNGVMTEKPMKYEEIRKSDEKTKENGRTKC